MRKVVVAAVDGGDRWFVHLPVFGFQLAFSVYRVLNIPSLAANGSIAVLQSGSSGLSNSIDGSSDVCGDGGT
jgi:hypothetical protein